MYLIFLKQIHVVPSEYSRNHFSSEKYKTLQLSKLHFLQNSPLCAIMHFYQLLWRSWKHSWKTFYENFFSSSVLFLIITLASQKHRTVRADFKRRKRVKISWMGGGGGVHQYCRVGLCREILDQNRLVSWSIVVKGKPVLGTFLSDRITKARMDCNTRLFIHSFIFITFNGLVAKQNHYNNLSFTPFDSKIFASRWWWWSTMFHLLWLCC